MNDNLPFCSKTLMRVVQEGVRDVIGRQRLTTVVNPDAPEVDVLQDPALLSILPGQVTAWVDALEGEYGQSGARGLLLRAGRASFTYFLREFGPQTGISAVEFRLLPTRARLLQGMQQVAAVLTEASLLQVSVEEQEKQWRCQVVGLQDSLPENVGCAVCHFVAGLLQEFLYWASGGKTFMIHHFGCPLENRNDCGILIDRQPLE